MMNNDGCVDGNYGDMKINVVLIVSDNEDSTDKDIDGVSNNDNHCDKDNNIE